VNLQQARQALDAATQAHERLAQQRAKVQERKKDQFFTLYGQIGTLSISTGNREWYTYC
jgi:hypothetical protein